MGTQAIDVKYPTRVYEFCAESRRPIIVQSGGTSSGKTYSVLQYLLTVAAYVPKQIITVAGQDIPNLRAGAYRDAQNILYGDEFLMANLAFHNRSNRQFLFTNGSVVEFNSYSDAQDAKSGKRNYLFVNEANGVPYEIFEELQVRTSHKTIIDFNPTAAFWAHEKLQGRDDVDWLDTTFRDNPFISDSIRSKILSYEPTPENIARGTANKYRWMVYGMGQVGRLEGLVFPDFQVTQEWPDQFKWRVFGLDFGFCVDDETEALTDNGWKKVEDLDKHDRFLTLNPETGESEWHQAERVTIFYGDHDVIEVDALSHSSVTTRHHKWMIEGRGNKGRFFRETQDIAASDKILCAASCSNLPTEKKHTDSLVELVAWFYTEGQIDAGGISIWHNEGECADRIRACLREVFGDELKSTRNGRKRAKAGWVERPKRRGNACHFAINLNGAEMLKRIAPGKVVSPSFISELTADQLELFISTSIDADGARLKSGTQTISQKDINRLHPLQMACSLAGYRTTLKTRKRKFSYKDGEWIDHTLTIFKGNSRLHIGELFHRRKQTKESKRRKVWCPTVKHGVWLARRKGSVYFTGNTNDPTAFVEVRYAHGNLYWKQHIYKTGLTNPDIDKELQRIGHQRDELIVADSAEPKSIEELRRAGWNVRPAEKGPDSVRQGIDALNRYPLLVHGGSKDLIEEFSSYTWKKDRNGNALNKPVDDFNHGIDAGRYAVSRRILKPAKKLLWA